ncbi:MAG: S66 peptidase family protein [Lutisporaceae bacterium]
MIPEKLKPGDEIRVIAPSLSLGIIPRDVQELANKVHEELGFRLTFGRHVNEFDTFRSSSIESRIEDLHESFLDKNVKAISAVYGGYYTNQMLRYIDFDIIRANPKIILGFSDITILLAAIYAKTGLVTYYAPNYSSYGMRDGLEYTLEYFKKCFVENSPFAVKAAPHWSDDDWYKNQDEREFIENNGYLIINEGTAEGKIIGGNLCTLSLLQGTEYMPDIRESIIFIEEYGDVGMQLFNRYLQSLIHQPGFDTVKGIVIGRFPKGSKVSDESLKYIIKSKKELTHIPVIANASFGHTTPQFAFPIGGCGRLFVKNGKVELEILEH